jgi:hypothetical protein
MWTKISTLLRTGERMTREEIRIPNIVLEWSDWFSWDKLERKVVNPPRSKRGVYEVKYADCDERLTIGKASDLYKRVVRGLVLGSLKHSTGKKIRTHENPSELMVRWAEAERPAAAEEALHIRYRQDFGCLPKYTKIT